jgi:drug/metabolite transporter (DMT)-like permease
MGKGPTMFNDRENFIGALLLIVCVIVGGVLIWQIATGERLRYTGPVWLAWLLFAVFLGGVLYGLYANLVRSRGTNQWPDPNTGRRTIWDRLRGRRDDQPH